ncbi:MAG: nucleoside recognition domain-containing protein [Emergencia sp.]
MNNIGENIPPLLHFILFGDFGLLTMTPRYLFLILFPVMTVLGICGFLLSRVPFLSRSHPLVSQFFYCFLGLGCTTAALASLDSVRDASMRRRMIFMLILLIPCSSQLAVIATFACLVRLRVFLVYLFFSAVFIALLYAVICRFYPLSEELVWFPQDRSSKSLPGQLCTIVRDAFLSVTGSAVPFCIGGILVSLAMYFGLTDLLTSALGPLLDRFTGLPPEAVSLLLLNVLKRDFSSASLLNLAGSGAFDGVQMVVLLIMLTFSVPCFNSTVLLFKQQKLPMACIIWLGSLCISLLFGGIVSRILRVFFL